MEAGVDTRKNYEMCIITFKMSQKNNGNKVIFNDANIDTMQAPVIYVITFKNVTENNFDFSVVFNVRFDNTLFTEGFLFYCL